MWTGGKRLKDCPGGCGDGVGSDGEAGNGGRESDGDAGDRDGNGEAAEAGFASGKVRAPPAVALGPAKGGEADVRAAGVTGGRAGGCGDVVRPDGAGAGGAAILGGGEADGCRATGG